MALSGVIHGPPLDDQPGQLCIANSNPSRSDSLRVCITSSIHSSLSDSTGPTGMPLPASKADSLLYRLLSLPQDLELYHLCYISIHPVPPCVNARRKGGLQNVASRGVTAEAGALLLQSSAAKAGLTRLTKPADDIILRKVRRSMSKRCLRM